MLALAVMAVVVGVSGQECDSANWHPSTNIRATLLMTLTGASPVTVFIGAFLYLFARRFSCDHGTCRFRRCWVRSACSWVTELIRDQGAACVRLFEYCDNLVGLSMRA